MDPATLAAASFAALIALVELVKFSVNKALAGDSKAKSDRMARQVQDLWDWHNKEDKDGVKLWYVRPSLEEAIVKLHGSIDNQTQVLRDISQAQATTAGVLLKIEERMSSPPVPGSRNR